MSIYSIKLKLEEIILIYCAESVVWGIG